MKRITKRKEKKKKEREIRCDSNRRRCMGKKKRGEIMSKKRGENKRKLSKIEEYKKKPKREK